MLFLRYWLPGLIIVAGFVFAGIRGFDHLGIAALFAFIAAGSSLWFMNFLMRVGLRGEADRDREEEARQYMEAHGHWPDDPPPR
jgi:small neutral amino acid transporter SnatA (MarC family)